MNSKSGKRRSPSPPSHGKHMDVAEVEAEEKGGRVLVVSKRTTKKAGRKEKKGEVGEVNLPNALIMPLFKDEDVKKAIRDSVSSVEVTVKVLPPKDAVTQALSMPYVAPKKPINIAAALLRSLNSPVPRKGGT
eukprot:10112560-Ditylum_brightwellii.AAC.1